MDLIKRTTITEVVAHRDLALQQAREAAELYATAYERAQAASDSRQRAAAGYSFYFDQSHQQRAYGALFHTLDVAESVEAFRRHLDASTWVHLLNLAGISRLMDRTATERFHADLTQNPPAVTEESVFQILSDLVADRDLIFQRSVARIFSELDRRFRSHDGWKLGSRIILTRIFDEWGSWSYSNHAREQIADCERIFAVLDGKPENPGALAAKIDASRQGFGRRQGTSETEYFRIHTFKNGNAHLWFKRDDLVEKVNRVLADYYGEVLADGVPRETTVHDYVSTALSRDLAYYPTPEPVVKTMLDHVHVHLERDADVLEPSAGTGNIALAALATGARVNAVEVDPGRVRALRVLATDHLRLHVTHANFLTLPPEPRYSHVLMNPPFAGTHWIDHILHAFDFLRPGGVLLSVVPATVETGSTAKHEAFRKWVQEHRCGGFRRSYYDLPAESFAPSGVRIQTSLLLVGKR